MGLISLTLPNDGETIDAADVNSPLNTIATAINGNLDNANIKTGAAIDGSKIADNSIPNTKMINAPLGWTAFANTPNTVTYNGNRNYDLVFNSVDLTSSLSPGMKLQLTRTVAAPDQCADLESGSTQYFNRASASLTGVTFTDDYTCMAWIKLESYTGGLQVMISRQNSTSGWNFYLNTVGQLVIQGANAGNADLVTSYASVPPNKWVHVAGSLNMSAGTGAVYFDGVEVASAYTNGSATAIVQAGNLEVGSYNGGASPFDGKLAQVAVFSSVLSAATIRSYASQGLAGSESTLVAAYSLDNDITDLSANNNDLTAQNSAVATATDSPFANAVSAGLLEYAEINSVAFSTNTTVNVRVPDTCMIPTSGGVSAVSYSTQSNPYGLPYFSNVLGLALNMVGQSGITSTTTVAVNGLATTVYLPAKSKVKVTVSCGITIANATANGLTVIVAGHTDITVTANRICESGYQSFANGAYGYAEASGVYENHTAGSYTFFAGTRVSASTGAISADTTRPAYVRVELV